ncbi:MAG TPA: beta-ketoacyl reductase, partial [Chitinophaga sp.]|uniref:beta-ketoacyl reductase n=1 Tax=Chitinophaga sp. TaxID=1869181 RepID=UPI002B6DABC7
MIHHTIQHPPVAAHEGVIRYEVPAVVPDPLPVLRSAAGEQVWFLGDDPALEERLREAGYYLSKPVIPEELFNGYSDDGEEYYQLLLRSQHNGTFPEFIVYALPLNGGGTAAEAAAAGIWPVFDIVRAWQRIKPAARIQLCYLYRQQQDYYTAVHEALIGFARSLRNETPLFDIKLIGLADAAAFDNRADILRREMRTPAFTGMLLFKDQGRFTVGLEASPEMGGNGNGHTFFRKNGHYLITGGAGGLGLIFARYLSETYQAHVSLCGRRAPDTVIRELLKPLKQVRYYQADVTNETAITALIATVTADSGPLRGVFHSAGVLCDNFLLKKTKAEFMSVIAPKLHGTVLLDEHTRDQPLDGFLLFSSWSAWLGLPGQCDYSFANSFLNAFAAVRHASNNRPGITRAVAWPLWQEGGMQLPAGAAAEYDTLSATAGITALENCLTGTAPVYFITRETDTKQQTMFSSDITSGNGKPAASLPATDLYSSALQLIKRILSVTTRISPEKFTEHKPLEEYGIESMMIAAINKELEQYFGEVS